MPSINPIHKIPTRKLNPAQPHTLLARCRPLAVYMLAALITAAIFHVGLLTRLHVDDGQKIGMPLLSSRADPSDNYVYFGLVKRGLDSCRRSPGTSAADVEGNQLACTYLGGVLTGHVLWRISEAITVSKRGAVSLLLVLNTALLAFTFLLAFSAIVERGFGIFGSIGLTCGALFLLDNFGLSFYAGKLNLDFHNVLGLEPNFSRLVNPSIFWSLGFATLAALLTHLRRPSAYFLAMGLIFAAVCSISGLAVTATLAAGLVLFLALEAVIARKVNWSVAAVAAILLAGLLYTLIQFRLFYATEMGKELQHGQLVDLKVNTAFFLLLLPVAFGRISRSEGERNVLMKCILLAAIVIGALSDSFALGDRLWLRGAAGIAFLACAAWLWNLGEGLAGRLPEQLRQHGWVGIALAGVALAGIINATVHARSTDFASGRGFLDRDKYEVLRWLEGRAESGMVVASTNIEDSFLVDFYTGGSPFVPLYGLSILSQPEQLKRYFHVIGLIEEGSTEFENVKTVTKDQLYNYNVAIVKGFREPYDFAGYQSLAFYHMLLYYPFNRSSLDIFAGDRPSKKFVDSLDQLWSVAQHRSDDYQYLIMRASERLKNSGPFDVVFRNDSYVILNRKHLMPSEGNNDDASP